MTYFFAELEHVCSSAPSAPPPPLPAVPDRPAADRKSFTSAPRPGSVGGMGGRLWRVSEPWSEAALERAAQAVAAWAMREEPAPWDPERQGRWASAIARLGTEEKA